MEKYGIYLQSRLFWTIFEKMENLIAMDCTSIDFNSSGAPKQYLNVYDWKWYNFDIN